MKKEMLLPGAPALTDSSRPVLPQQQSFAMILQSPTQHSMTHNNVCASGLKMTGNLPPAANADTKQMFTKKNTHDMLQIVYSPRLFSRMQFARERQFLAEPPNMCWRVKQTCCMYSCFVQEWQHVAWTAQCHVCPGRSAKFLSGQRFQRTCSNMKVTCHYFCVRFSLVKIKKNHPIVAILTFCWCSVVFGSLTQSFPIITISNRCFFSP